MSEIDHCYTLNYTVLLESFEKGRQKLKEKAISEYEAALKMPRKKKKQAKKSAELLYSIACWNPLDL